ncbi:MAG: sulfotransferase family protein [Desulfobulbaceae bacterium]|nr:MAG: sulfotransferase family protein [Desulfobulbaceae bacterium]
MKRFAPIIIIGMHRSGTSMIARMLEELGLFLGVRKDRHNEALLFIKLNNWLMEQNSCSWDNPRDFSTFFDNDIVHNLTVGYLRNILQSRYMVSYLGKRLLQQRGPAMQLHLPWGWKDPRTTFTLPVWREIFPGARVIHVHRNGVDVANSLKTRHEKILERSQRKWAEGRYRPRYRFWRELTLRGVGDSIRCSSLEGSFSLWEEYISEARRHMAAMADDGLEVCYEEFLADPVPRLQAMVDFCRLPPVAHEKLVAMTDKVNKERANAFCNNSELVAFAESVAGRLAAQGYPFP